MKTNEAKRNIEASPARKRASEGQSCLPPSSGVWRNLKRGVLFQSFVIAVGWLLKSLPATSAQNVIPLFTSKSRFLASHADWDREHSFGDRYAESEKKTASNLQEGVLVFHYAVLESSSGGASRRSLNSSKPDARTSKWGIGSARASAGLNQSVLRPRFRS